MACASEKCNHGRRDDKEPGFRCKAWVRTARSPDHFKAVIETDAFREIYEDFDERLQEYCNIAQRRGGRSSLPLSIGHTVLVRHRTDNTTTWHRATVKSKLNQRIQVWFTDALECHTCDHCDIISELPSFIMKVPCNAMTCKLSGLRPVRCLWSTKAIYRFQTLVVDQHLDAHVHHKDSNGVVLISLFVGETHTPVRDYLVGEELARPIYEPPPGNGKDFRLPHISTKRSHNISNLNTQGHKYYETHHNPHAEGASNSQCSINREPTSVSEATHSTEMATEHDNVYDHSSRSHGAHTWDEWDLRSVINRKRASHQNRSKSLSEETNDHQKADSEACGKQSVNSDELSKRAKLNPESMKSVSDTSLHKGQHGVQSNARRKPSGPPNHGRKKAYHLPNAYIRARANYLNGMAIKLGSDLPRAATVTARARSMDLHGNHEKEPPSSTTGISYRPHGFHAERHIQDVDTGQLCDSIGSWSLDKQPCVTDSNKHLHAVVDTRDQRKTTPNTNGGQTVSRNDSVLNKTGDTCIRCPSWTTEEHNSSPFVGEVTRITVLHQLSTAAVFSQNHATSTDKNCVSKNNPRNLLNVAQSKKSNNGLQVESRHQPKEATQPLYSHKRATETVKPQGSKHDKLNSTHHTYEHGGHGDKITDNSSWQIYLSDIFPNYAKKLSKSSSFADEVNSKTVEKDKDHDSSGATSSRPKQSHTINSCVDKDKVTAEPSRSKAGALRKYFGQPETQVSETTLQATEGITRNEPTQLYDTATSHNSTWTAMEPRASDQNLLPRIIGDLTTARSGMIGDECEPAYVKEEPPDSDEDIIPTPSTNTNHYMPPSNVNSEFNSYRNDNSDVDEPDNTEILVEVDCGEDASSTSCRLTEYQKNILSRKFAEKIYPTRMDYDEMALDMGVAKNEIQKWYKNARNRLKTKLYRAGAGDTSQSSTRPLDINHPMVKRFAAAQAAPHWRHASGGQSNDPYNTKG